MSSRTFTNITSYLASEAEPEILVAGLQKIESGEVSIFGFSGKKGSGKDTVSDLVASFVIERDGLKATALPYAFHLKQEATSIINSIDTVLRANVSVSEMTERLAGVYRIPVTEMADIYHIVQDHVCKGISIPNGWTRSTEVWELLRYLGTEVRQSQDKLYWVRKTFSDVLENAANGVSTFVNDVRFMHEVGPLQDIGGFVTRVDITQEAQLRRLSSRDGVIPDESALVHLSETGLDHYTGFDYRFDNSEDGGLEEKAEMVYGIWKANR